MTLYRGKGLAQGPSGFPVNFKGEFPTFSLEREWES